MGGGVSKIKVYAANKKSNNRALSQKIEALQEQRRFVTMPAFLRSADQDIESYTPSFFIKNASVTTESTQLTKASWEKIVSGEAPGFKQIQHRYAHTTCLVFFYEEFYRQLFQLYPEVEILFQSSRIHQGRRMLRAVMGMAYLKDYNIREVEKKLIELATTHNKIGVLPENYAGFMTLIINVLKICLGADWSYNTEKAWVLTVSFFLQIMLPVSINQRGNMSPFQVAGQKRRGARDYKYNSGNEHHDNSPTRTDFRSRSFFTPPRHHLSRNFESQRPTTHAMVKPL